MKRAPIGLGPILVIAWLLSTTSVAGIIAGASCRSGHRRGIIFAVCYLAYMLSAIAGAAVARFFPFPIAQTRSPEEYKRLRTGPLKWAFVSILLLLFVTPFAHSGLAPFVFFAPALWLLCSTAGYAALANLDRERDEDQPEKASDSTKGTTSKTLPE